MKGNGCTTGFIPAFYSEFIKNVLINDMNFAIKNIECDEKDSTHYKLKISVTEVVTENLLKGEKLKLLVIV